jgi:hypothetical protein
MQIQSWKNPDFFNPDGSPRETVRELTYIHREEQPQERAKDTKDRKRRSRATTPLTATMEEISGTRFSYDV